MGRIKSFQEFLLTLLTVDYHSAKLVVTQRQNKVVCIIYSDTTMMTERAARAEWSRRLQTCITEKVAILNNTFSLSLTV